MNTSPRTFTRRNRAIRIAAGALAVAALTASCAKTAESTSPPPASNETTSESNPSDTTESTAPASTGKVTGENLLSWSDYSGLGAKGLTVRFTAKPGEATLSQCETSDLRGATDRTALWQSGSEASKEGVAVPNQQIASFGSASGADEAMAALEAWNKDCHFAAVKHEDLNLDGDVHATYWLRDLDGHGGELVMLVHLPERVSYLTVFGPTDVLKDLDAQAIATKTADRLA
jgi:hypothetical protein